MKHSHVNESYTLKLYDKIKLPLLITLTFDFVAVKFELLFNFLEVKAATFDIHKRLRVYVYKNNSLNAHS